MLGGFGAAATGRSGYEGARRNRKTSGWLYGKGSPATDILLGLPELRGKSRDLQRNHPLAAGAVSTKTNGVVGSGLKLRSVLDARVLGIEAEEASELQYQIEREWEIFERECDFTGTHHLKDNERTIYNSAKVSGDIGIARRWRKRSGDTYGTRIVMLEADRISNPREAPDSATLQDGVVLSADGEELGYWVADKHPGDITGGAPKWAYVSRRGPSGMLQMILARQIYRPGQVRGVPMFAPIIDVLKQLGLYTDAEVKAAINDAYLFAFEKPATEVDEDGQPIITRPSGEADDEGELTLDDLAITTLSPGSDVTVKKPERPNTAFDGFVSAFSKYIGVALELPYEVLLMHFSSSFSASRAALELAWKGFLTDQDWLIREVLDPVREWQFTEMVASGRFDAPGFFDDPIRRAAWLGRVWVGPTRIQINPQVEANADKSDVEMGFKSREQVMTERTGGDFDTKSVQILRERAVLGASAPSAPQTNDAKADDGTDKTKGDDDE